MDMFELSVHPTEGSPGLPPTLFERLSSEWSGTSIKLPFWLGYWQLMLPVVGWSMNNGGNACAVHIVKSRYKGAVGFLVYGGDGGVRVLSDDKELFSGTVGLFHRGWVQPFVWIEKARDLPKEVQQIIIHSSAFDAHM